MDQTTQTRPESSSATAVWNTSDSAASTCVGPQESPERFRTQTESESFSYSCHTSQSSPEPDAQIAG